LIPALLGAGIGLGLYLLWAGLTGRNALPRLTGGGPAGPPAQRNLLRAAVTAGVAVAVLGATGWVAGAALAALIALLAPALLGGRKSTDGAIARTEALASWAHQLRDTMAAAGGLEQAIEASATVAPDAIAQPVRRLALRTGRQPLPEALRAFADEVADPLADKIAVALSAAATSGAGDLTGLLGKLADSAQEEARMLLRVQVSRTSIRTSVAIISSVFILFAALMVVLRREYLAPYDSLQGQLVLVLVGGVFLFGLWLLIRLAATRPAERLFTNALGDDS
jgi:Flp pilus assembly protein TadB